jgi:hypothetical protein
VDDEGMVTGRLTDPMAALVAEDVLSALGAESEGHHQVGRCRGSRLTGLVGSS